MNKWKRIMAFAAAGIIAAGTAACGAPEEHKEAVYLGVVNYGAEETNRDNLDRFTYRFEMDGAEVTYNIKSDYTDDKGNRSYPVQNKLKEGYRFDLTVKGDTVTDAKEIEGNETAYVPKVQGKPGVLTLANLLKTAQEPAGTTLYIYGGGWNWQDESASVQARSLGVSSDWVTFFNSQDEDYTFKAEDPAHSYYPYGSYNEYYYAGLDCSSYMGWIIYNTFETENDREGYVRGSTGFAKMLSEQGWGEWTQDIEAPDGENGYEMKPGDIMSINGHVWMSLGTCEDGSVVILHSSPSDSRTGQPGAGVQISAIGEDESCEAYLLADEYMSEYYPEWYERYPIYLCDPDTYFSFEGEDAGRFTWNTNGKNSGLTDEEHLQDMDPAEVLEFLYEDI